MNEQETAAANLILNEIKAGPKEQTPVLAKAYRDLMEAVSLRLRATDPQGLDLAEIR